MFVFGCRSCQVIICAGGSQVSFQMRGVNRKKNRDERFDSGQRIGFGKNTYGYPDIEFDEDCQGSSRNQHILVTEEIALD